MAIVRVLIRTEAEANQFVSIIDSAGFELIYTECSSKNCKVGHYACVWTNLKEASGYREEFVFPDETLTVNQLYVRLKGK